MINSQLETRWTRACGYCFAWSSSVNIRWNGSAKNCSYFDCSVQHLVGQLRNNLGVRITDAYICGQEQDEANIVRSIRAVPEAREGSCDSRRITYRLPHHGHGGSYVPGQHSGVPIGGPCLVVGGEMLLMGERRKCEGCGRRRHLRSCAALMGQQMPANCGLGLVNLQ